MNTTVGPFAMADRVPSIVAVITGHSSGLLLLLFIWTKSRKHLGSYREVLTAHTVVSIIYSEIHFVVDPNIRISGSILIIVNNGFLRNHLMTGYLFSTLYWAIQVVGLLLILSQAYYRYIVVCEVDKLEELYGCTLLRTFIPAFCVFISWFIAACFGMQNPELKSDYSANSFLHWYRSNFKRTHLSFLAIQYWNTDIKGARFRVDAAIFTAFYISTIGVALGFIIYYNTHVFFKLRSSEESMSPIMKRLNYQLLSTLVCQTIISFLIIYIPLIVFLMLPMFTMNTNGMVFTLADTAFIVYSKFWPTAQNLVTICIVKDIRKSLCCRGNSASAVVEPIQMQDLTLASVQASLRAAAVPPANGDYDRPWSPPVYINRSLI